MQQGQLWDELRKYGYEFTWKKGILTYLGGVAFSVGLGLFFHLDGVYLVILCGACLFMLPFFLRNLYENRYEQKNFMDANTYMEQFLYSFQKSGKILTTLHDVSSIFGPGDMKNEIEKAIDYIENTYDESDVESRGLALISKAYPASQIASMHRFVCQVEHLGGEYGNAILLMLDARSMWADRTYELLKEKKRKRQQVIISIAVSLLLCSSFVYVAKQMNLSITGFAVAKFVTLATLLVDLIIFYAADKKLTLRGMEETYDDEELLRQYQKVMRNQEKRHKEVGYGIAKRKVTRAIQKLFPQWLLEVSLLLQSENVQVAIMQSYKEAPVILKPALDDLLKELRLHPTDMEPYLGFLSEFSIPEVQSSMKMLYSLSEGCGGNANGQITDIIRRNQNLLDQAQKMKNEDALAGMQVLFLAPQLSGGAKMLADMVMLFYVLMQSMAVAG